MKRTILLAMAAIVAVVSGCAVYTPGPPGVSIAYYDDHPHHRDHRRW